MQAFSHQCFGGDLQADLRRNEFTSTGATLLRGSVFEYPYAPKRMDPAKRETPNKGIVWLRFKRLEVPLVDDLVVPALGSSSRIVAA